MGTRGAYGFHRGGKTKATYNHYDSYPSELGVNVASFVAKSNMAEMNRIFDDIILVDDNSKPTEEQIKECIEYFDGGVSTGSTEEWYALLRNAQGKPIVYKYGLKYMIDGQDFLKDSLFCEWAYIINLDDEVLEVYKGFQEEPDYNRYYDDSLAGEEYKNCKLIAQIKLSDFMKMGEIFSDVVFKQALGEVYY